MEGFINSKPKIYKHILRIIATLLVCVMVLNFFPIIVLGIKANEDILNIMNNIGDENSNTNNAEEEIKNDQNKEGQTKDADEVDEAKIIGENEEKRELNKKEFILDDGTTMLAIYQDNIHYKKDGKLLDIDNSVKESQDEEEKNSDEKVYENISNSFNMKFAKKSNKNKLATLSINNSKIKWSLNNAEKVEAKATKNENKEQRENGKNKEKVKLNNISSGEITYENILKNIDIRYNIVSDTVKEDIILKNKSAVGTEISFEYDIGKLKMEKTEKGEIIISEPNAENVLLIIDVPYMYDSKLEMSNQIETNITKQKNGKYTLTIKPNKEWLESEDRVYPVTIDPTVSTSLNRGDIQDTYIFNGDSGYPNRYNAHILRIGSNNTLASKNPIRGLIKFNIPDLKPGDQVVKAVLNMCSYPDTNEWNPPNTQMQFNVHKVTSDWTSQTANWGNMNANYNSKIEDYILYNYTSSDPYKFYDFDITSIVKDWYITGNNYGVMIKDNTEVYNAPHSDAYFYSSDVSNSYTNARPIIQIIYRNQTGLEGYQTYHTQNVGRAGTVYTNDYNGNLTLVHEDLSTPGSRMPVGIKHIYNTNDANLDYGYGRGFRLNLFQTVEIQNISGTEYAKYIDEDGTAHYFPKEGSSNVYKDEDGLGLTLTLTNNTFYMTDKDNNKFTFVNKKRNGVNVWMLKEAIDSYNNKMIIDLVDDAELGARITKVTDAAGDYITLTYNSNNKLTTMTDMNGRSINYVYDANWNITEIKYPDGKKSIYVYTNGLVTTVKNVDNSYVCYGYYSDKAKRVKVIKEYSIANELGNTLNISYGDNTTTFSDDKGYSNKYAFNNLGQTLNISDFGKDNQNIDNAYGKVYEYGTSGSNKNKLTLEGKLMSINQMQNNLIVNGNFSNGLNNWQQTNLEGTDVVTNGAFKIRGNAGRDKNVYQVINVAGQSGDIFTIAGWAKNNGVPDKTVGMHVYLVDQNNQLKYAGEGNFSSDSLGWQFLSKQIISKTSYKSIYVYLVCSNNANDIYFDNIGLFKEEFGQSYTYDEKGNVISTQNNAKNNSTFNYDNNNNLITSINPKGGKFTYEYDNTNSKKLVSAINSTGNKYSFNYDAYGNMTEAKVTGSIPSSITLGYDSHLSFYGWKGTVQNGEISGTLDTNNGFEAIKINLQGAPTGAKLSYQAHVQNIGWQSYVTSGVMAGTTGQSLRMEAIKIKLEGMTGYTLKYRAYVEGKGWGQWVNSDGIAGTIGEAKKILGIQILLEKSDSKFIQTKAEYNSNGNYKLKEIDEQGNASSQYTYNTKTGTISTIKDVNGKDTIYSYDNIDRLSTVRKVSNNKTYQNTYSYENDRLKTITHNGFAYTFMYDNFGNTKQVKVGTQTLITNNYEANNGNLSSSVYGNNQTISYNYDRFNRIIKTTGTNGNYQYTYDGKSNLKTIVDSVNGTTQTYTYDLADRLVKETNTNGFTSEYGYDINNNISLNRYTFAGKINEVKYNYDKANRLTNMTLNGTISWTNGMDALSRIVSKNISNGTKTYSTSYTYSDVTSVANKTTTQLKTIKNGAGDALTYTYDKIGNIETITKGSTLINRYYYDELNQLVRENSVVQNKTITYEYDTGGNLLNKKEYGYTTADTIGTTLNKTTTYTYGNTNWKDQLTSYNGKAITYDGIGNPLTYDGNTYSWQNGRQLSGITNTGKSQTITYKYNNSGIRTEKTVNGVKTNYYLDGSKVIYEKTGNNIIYYIYDENGMITALRYNDINYYYIKNAQNDIVGLLDTNLNQVVSYEYDSWGNILSIKDASGNQITSNTHIGIINPYRYRSYRYDTETNLYYLQSRYYSSEWGRFVNADGTLLDKNAGLIGTNIYAYCGSNYANNYDPTGKGLIQIIVNFISSIFDYSIYKETQNAPKNVPKISNPIRSTATQSQKAINQGIINIAANSKVSYNISANVNKGLGTVGVSYGGTVAPNAKINSRYVSISTGASYGIGLPISPSISFSYQTGMRNIFDIINIGTYNNFNKGTDFYGFTGAYGAGLYYSPANPGGFTLSPSIGFDINKSFVWEWDDK